MAVQLDDIWTVSAGDVDYGAIDFTDYLDSTEKLASVSTPVEQATADLAFANVAVSTAALTIKNRTSAIGKAVQFKFSGQVAGRTYTVRVTAVTDSTPARTKVVDQIIDCVD
jgi:hypothetical protein